MKRLVAAMLACIAIAETAEAITVVPESGEALVNYGGGFLPVVKDGSEVFVGSTVMLRPGATAIIAYDACRVRVGDAQVWSIQSTPPCPPGSNFLDLTAPPAPGFNPDTTTLVVGGAVVAGGIAAAIALSGGDDDKSVSAD